MQLLRQNRIASLPKIIFILVFLLACWARASEAPVPGGPMADPEEGAEKTIKKPLEEANVREWRDDETRIQKLKSSLEKQKTEIEELYAAKAQAKHKHEIVDLSRDLNLKIENMKRDYADYKKLLLHIRFKHPEKGNFAPHKYQREEPFSQDENHFDLSLQGKLDKAKTNFEAHYTVVHKKPAVSTEAEAIRAPAAVVDPKRILLSK